MDDYRLIDYDHSRDDQTCNAVLVTDHGGASAAWNFDHLGELACVERTISEEVFAVLWDGITASLDMGGVFWTGLVTDPSQLVDPGTHHVVTMVQAFQGRVQHCTFMIPVGEVDPVFSAWLSVLQATRQPLPVVPARRRKARKLVMA